MFDVTFVLPGLVQSGGVRAVFEMADELRLAGRSTAIVVPERSLLSPRRSVAGILERTLPAGLMPVVQRIAHRRPATQSWFPLQTPIVVAGSPLRRDIPESRAVVATSWRTAEEVERLPDFGSRAVYFLQHYETWSGSARRVDATWRAFDRLIVSSEWLRWMAGERFGKSDVGLAVYGVDLDVFQPRPEGVHVAPVVGFMHDDREWKGGVDMLAALESIRARRALTVKAFGLGTRPLPDWVEFVGRLTGSALADFYNSLDVFASASWTETGPMTVPEAMACGVAVVTTDVGNVRVWSAEGGCTIVPPRDPPALAGGIEALLEDTDRRAAAGAAGRAAIQPFTWRRTASQFETALISFGLLDAR